MAKILGIMMIGGGAVILLNIVLMAVGGLKIMIGLIMPISFKFMPLNEKLQAWVDVPLTMGLDAYITDIQAISEEGFIAGGIMEFKVTLSSGGPEDAEIEAVPVIFIQEDAEIDEIQRYVLRAGPLNYPSILAWLVALGSIGALFLAVIQRFRVRGKGGSSADEKRPASVRPESASVAPEPGPPDIVSVIPLDDDIEKQPD